MHVVQCISRLEGRQRNCSSPVASRVDRVSRHQAAELCLSSMTLKRRRYLLNNKLHTLHKKLLHIRDVIIFRRIRPTAFCRY